MNYWRLTFQEVFLLIRLIFLEPHVSNVQLALVEIFGNLIFYLINWDQ